MADQAQGQQPGFLTQLLQKILSGSGLQAAAAQGGPTAPPQGGFNPNSGAPPPMHGGAPAAPAPSAMPAQQQSDPQGDLAKIIQQQMAVAQAQKAEEMKKKLTAPAAHKRGAPSSQVDTAAPLMQLFGHLMGKVS